MEADAAEPCPVEEGAEVAIQVRGIDRPSCRRAEDEAVVPPVVRCCPYFSFLYLTVFLERVDALAGEGDASFGGSGFGG